MSKREIDEGHNDTGIISLWIVSSILFLFVVGLSLYIALCMCGCCYDTSAEDCEPKKQEETPKDDKNKKEDKKDKE